MNVLLLLQDEVLVIMLPHQVGRERVRTDPSSNLQIEVCHLDSNGKDHCLDNFTAQVSETDWAYSDYFIVIFTTTTTIPMTMSN